MSEYKVKYEHLVDELGILFKVLQNTIDGAKRELDKVFSNLDELQDKKYSESDYSYEIQKRFESGTQLTRSQMKYYWANFNSFDVSLIPWCVQFSPAGSFIERCLLKTWGVRSRGEAGYGILGKYLGPPSFLPAWSVLDDIQKLQEFADKEVPKFLIRPDHFAGMPIRSLFFRYLIADYCHRRMDQQYLIHFLAGIEGTHFSPLHYSTICETQSLDPASKLMIATLLKFFRSGKVEEPQFQLWLNQIKTFLGDPRALGNKWGPIEEIEPEGYINWLSSLNEEDILFFFENLDKVIHPERREFWLRFVHGAKRIAVVLDADKRLKLMKKYQSNEKMLEIIRRSYQFRSNGTSDQQLIIYFFDEYVFVEGSNTGFACQIFDEKTFKSKFKASFYSHMVKNDDRVIQEMSYSSFRGSGSGIIKALRHMPASLAWERNFLNEFAELNIFPDRFKSFIKTETPSEIVQKSSALKEQDVSGVRSTKIESSTASPKKMTQVGFNDFMIELTRKKAIVIQKNGLSKMWVIYDPDLVPIIDRMTKNGFKMRLAYSGSRATDGRMAWYLDE